MSTRTRSPEVDELSCVPETRQSQQAAGVEELVVGVVDPVQMSDTERVTLGWRHSMIRTQVMRIHRIHRLLLGHRVARARLTSIHTVTAASTARAAAATTDNTNTSAKTAASAAAHTQQHSQPTS